jgi:hypothetical protein
MHVAGNVDPIGMVTREVIRQHSQICFFKVTHPYEDPFILDRDRIFLNACFDRRFVHAGYFFAMALSIKE